MTQKALDAVNAARDAARGIPPVDAFTDTDRPTPKDAHYERHVLPRMVEHHLAFRGHERLRFAIVDDELHITLFAKEVPRMPDVLLDERMGEWLHLHYGRHAAAIEAQLHGHLRTAIEREILVDALQAARSE